jgi:hypothetical protein
MSEKVEKASLLLSNLIQVNLHRKENKTDFISDVTTQAIIESIEFLLQQLIEEETKSEDFMSGQRKD